MHRNTTHCIVNEVTIRIICRVIQCGLSCRVPGRHDRCHNSFKQRDLCLDALTTASQLRGGADETDHNARAHQYRCRYSSLLMGKKFKQLKERLGEIADLGHATAVLGWDQETYMPNGAAHGRSEQLGTLSKLTHEMFVAPATLKLLKDAATVPEVLKRGTSAAIVRQTTEDYRRARKLPADFVAEISRTASQAQHAWMDARKKSDFKLFASWLKKNVVIAQRTAEYLGYTEHPYDALLDQYEPGMKTSEVHSIFADLRTKTVPLIRAVAARADRVGDTAIHQHFDKGAQERFGRLAAERVGYDFNRGRVDYTTHPFCTTFGIDDVRITTRIDEEFFNPYLFGMLHEVGHALYEQGVDRAYDRTPLASGASLGLHESQSRMWENLVGRGREFWQFMWPDFVQHFPQMNDVGIDAFYDAINKVVPSFIRVEADELTYNMHIMVRFEMEVAMVEGGLKVKDIPEVWNQKYHDYLGITPPTAALGCLQDTHWAGTGIGYFSTYSLGNIISAQLFQTAEKDIPNLRTGFATGQFKPLLDWLRKHVHQHGRRYKPQELVKRVTGSTIDATAYIAYLTAKYSDIYGL